LPILKRKRTALVVLEDGSVFQGHAFAGGGEALGEVVFNTAMSGYQEVLTDPSYKGQIVTMTYPMMGNYGINEDDMESLGIHLEGFLCREYHPTPSNWRSRRTLGSFLEDHGKIGVEGLDTRALTRRIRTAGAMRGIVSTDVLDVAVLLSKVRAYPGLVGRDLVREVTCRAPYRWRGGRPSHIAEAQENGGRPRAAVLDCGVKFNILRMLEARGCSVFVFPAAAGREEILSCRPDGLLLSNGPGDPAALTHIAATVRSLLGELPIFGICLGHQLLGMAVGGRTAKLKFGHHGVNQPVKNLLSGRVEISSQNHGFVVEAASVEGGRATHLNLNDGTSEGFFYPDLKAFSVQYHPEAAPGPHDAAYLFDLFVALMRNEASLDGWVKGGG